MVLNLIASKVIRDWENICKKPVEDYGHLWRLMVISITVNYPYLTTNIPSPIWLRTCLLQKLLVFAVYQKLADSVGHCFFSLQMLTVRTHVRRTPSGESDSILFTLPAPILREIQRNFMYSRFLQKWWKLINTTKTNRLPSLKRNAHYYRNNGYLVCETDTLQRYSLSDPSNWDMWTWSSVLWWSNHANLD